MTEAPTPFTPYLSQLSHSFEQLHTAKEDAFWCSYMGLDADVEGARKTLQEREIAVQRWIQSPERLAEVRGKLALAEAARTDPQRAVDRASQMELIALQGWVAALEANSIETAEARSQAEHIVELESELAKARGGMKLGYQGPDGFVPASSVKLGVMLRSEPREELRKAAFHGLRSIETHVLDHGFLELVKQRNRLGRMLGGEDYYDATVRRVEGLTKVQIFEWLDQLEELTRGAAQRGIEQLRQRGDTGLPWNLPYEISGDVTTAEDPYFPFSQALGRWGRSFAALGVDYNGAELVLDLIDRPGKYENGFMHGPVPAWRDSGRYRPARIQFTANAIPGMIGSGRRATETLFHEGGHAAHFANIDMPAPCFAQEFAPTSVAFAEVQSMFFDSLVSDADWQTRYAHTAAGQPMPFDLMQRAIQAKQPYEAWRIRSMLTVPYVERALYEMSDSELTPENVLAVMRQIEEKLTLAPGGGPRPVLSIPHLLAGESSAYYHGYVLAEMGVVQTREFFQQRDGRLVDNPAIGPDLKKVYWTPGNSRRFGEFIETLTGEPFSPEPLGRQVNRTVETTLAEAERSIEHLQDVPVFDGEVDLKANLRVMHGTAIVAGGEGKPFAETSRQFAAWIDERIAENG
ncbi:M3 family metallopeptidase [Lignipirellula cremea]|uniref:Peptidase family M3 n=1 Tax=Lignipirellula cremea TaxID=2528010 RepID=A0A518E510_9BACT|nr:M3 family metallopeptidase [Lignipirellula cremea]QDU99185.1 Peptidase family M3 [Lignipirellula cremea]